MWFIFWIFVLVVVIVGASVLIGKTLARPREEPLSRHERLTALKASGAMPNRKESRR